MKLSTSVLAALAAAQLVTGNPVPAVRPASNGCPDWRKLDYSILGYGFHCPWQTLVTCGSVLLECIGSCSLAGQEGGINPFLDEICAGCVGSLAGICGNCWKNENGAFWANNCRAALELDVECLVPACYESGGQVYASKVISTSSNSTLN